MILKLSDIKDYFRGLHSQLSAVPHFIFGCDEFSLRESIASFSGMYMFVDFGQITTFVDQNNCMVDKFEMAITIAYPFGVGNVANDDIVKLQSEALEIIKSIRRQMYADQREMSWLKYLSPSHQILPFVAPDLARSIGWTLSFNLEGCDIFGIK